MCDKFFVFIVCVLNLISIFFFFNDTATTEIYTLSLHDALPIYPDPHVGGHRAPLRQHVLEIDVASDVAPRDAARSEEHTSELQSQSNLVCRLLLEKKKNSIPQLSPSPTSHHSLTLTTTLPTPNT